MSHVRRGTVICGQCTVMMDKVPNARIVPPSIPDVNLGPSLSAEKSWKMDVLRGAMKMPTRPPPAIHVLSGRSKEKEFSPEDLDNDFKYQNLFEVLFSPDLHLLSAMFEVMPDDAEVSPWGTIACTCACVHLPVPWCATTRGSSTGVCCDGWQLIQMSVGGAGRRAAGSGPPPGGQVSAQ